MRKCCLQIVDSDPIVHTGLRVLLPETRYSVTSSALSAADAIEDSRRTAIDLVILNLDLCDRPGECVLDYYRMTRPVLPVLIYSANEEFAAASRCMERGARGYVCKRADNRELLEAVDQLFQGGRPYLSRRLRVGPQHKETYGVPLTPREAEIAGLVASGHDSKSISAKLGISKETVKKHRASVLKKFDANKSTQIAAFIWQEKLLRHFGKEDDGAVVS